ncbi:MAG: bifunctional precorrin-2 dehydrogenase/sirohydrochlorin ferrochelatase [Clostridia bacterium]|nr:bifunctional precorrin-2 dehydrogenase/sirohydrochlorin ferrochelatase [Clostridia bacterium]
MAVYFPIFTDLRGKKVIIVGSSQIGGDKAKKLMSFGASVTFWDGPVTDPVQLIRKAPDAVVVVDVTLVDTTRLYEECTAARIPINTVDVPEACSFIFPSMTQKGALTVAISTGGACPAAGMWVKKTVEEILPAKTDDIIEWLSGIRESLKENVPSETRKLIIRELTAAAFDAKCPLEDTQTERIINRFYP